MRPLIIIKVGTSTLIRQRPSGETLNHAGFDRIARQIHQLRADGYDIVIVSSAAIGGGMLATRQTTRPARDGEIPELQRLASIGWRLILDEWQRALGDILVGEMLLTGHSLSLSHERAEALNLIRALHNHGDIPIINENDSITHDEIAFGDNDTLGATVAAKLAQSSQFSDDVHFVMLSDIDGVYRNVADPTTVIAEIDRIDEFHHVIGDTQTHYGTGGMTTKFRAAAIARASGVTSYIVNGSHDDSIIDGISRRSGTRFVAQPGRDVV